jgi:hypothetical protein
MRNHPQQLVTALFVISMINASASVLYVDANSPGAKPPYTNWATAATDIQAAIDVATDGDLVLVTNGLYQTGGRVVYGALTNRVAVDKPLTLQSVNGPSVTLIRGYVEWYSDLGVRCVYMTNRAVVSGFTLTNGSGRLHGAPSAEVDGGGLWCESLSATVSNCVITGNRTWGNGGGTYSGTLTNCMLAGNLAGGSGGGPYNADLENCVVSNNVTWSLGGGASYSSLNGCSVVGNVSGGGANVTGGGAAYCSLSNCTLVSNSAYQYGGGAFSSTLSWCVISSNSVALWGGGAAGGVLTHCTIIGNTAKDLQVLNSPPGLGGGVYQAALTNCILESNYATEGGGAYGAVLESCTVSNNVGASFGGGVYGGTVSVCTIRSNHATNGYPEGEGGGAYQATLNNCNLFGNSARQGGGAAACSLTNCTLSTNSVWQYGGGTSGGYLDTCTLTTNSAFLGGGVVGGTLVNCVLTGNYASYYGGGAGGCTSFGCDAPVGTLINCSLVGNRVGRGYDGTLGSAQGWGGGAYQVSLIHCLISGNFAGQGGGGAANSDLTDCIVVSNTHGDGGYGAGGVDVSTSTRCVVANNIGGDGGGARGGTLLNCAITGNWGGAAGGAWSATLNNCTLVGNSSYQCGGVAGGTLNNCIVYSNTAFQSSNPNYVGVSGFNTNYPPVLNYCCTMPMPTNGVGNITNEPMVLDMLSGDCRLQTNSPCINAGRNDYISGTTDLDGNSRITGVTVDIGAYEFQSPASILSYAWLQHYGLPNNGSADFADTDGDGMNNWQEWIAGTDPIRAVSVLRMLPLVWTNSPEGIALTWQSVTNRSYYVQLATSLSSSQVFSTLATNVPGQSRTTTFVDTNPTPLGSVFYRVGVK